MKFRQQTILHSLFPKFFLVLYMFLLPAVSVFTQEDSHYDNGEFWISPGAESAMYTFSGMAYGGSLTLGYSRRVTIGLKAAYLLDKNSLSTLEFNFLFRWYFQPSMQGDTRYSGPFVQFLGGPVFCAEEDASISIPADYGIISAGLCLGWRFLLGDRWFAEPYIRGGHPYLIGAGLSAGVRF